MNEMRHYDLWNIIMMTQLMVTDGLLNFGSAKVCDWSIIERYEMLSTTPKFCLEGEELWSMALSTRATEELVAPDHRSLGIDISTGCTEESVEYRDRCRTWRQFDPKWQHSII
jgi:hypothetical protein